jgi:TIR domain
VAGSQRAVHLLLRWSVAVAVCLVLFAGVWLAWESLQLPPAGSDRLGVALAVAAVVSTASGGPLFWWAARENSHNRNDSSSEPRTDTPAAEVTGGPAEQATRRPSSSQLHVRDNAPVASPAAVSHGSKGHKPAVSPKPPGHAFISYATVDSTRVDQLQEVFEEAGIPVWRDRTNLWPGEDWRIKIRRAITDDTLAFIACFSTASLAREKSYQNEELNLAIEQLRMRRPDNPWLIPVRLDECEIPDIDLGGGRTLSSIQRADLFGDESAHSTARLIETILRIIGQCYPTAVDARPISKPAPSTTGVLLSPDAANDLQALHPRDKQRVLIGLERIASGDTTGAHILRRSGTGIMYMVIRSNDYRIVFTRTKPAGIDDAGTDPGEILVARIAKAGDPQAYASL